ncbi:hypothetical protein [Cellulomonas sp. NS3]|uniref:hypothetical protein n=1 Tax=Cellulomonas sp. NS3 TaxID=2973977 RepID=UPI0021627F93|nr:hypothetical protein [Cellulomonas sp. NS3]
MSMAAPFLPHGEPDPGVPAADVGHGGPPPAEGFGVEGEEPDRVPDGDAEAADEGALRPGTLDDPPFRTPDPGELQGS